MNANFADTSYYLALLNPKDQFHQRAVEVASTLDCQIITTAWVITELGDGMAYVPACDVFLEFLDDTTQDPYTTIIEPNPDIFQQGLELYRNRRDKNWSLTDCISFVAMGQHGLTDALTADQHFTQAGFRILL
jgi:predicted nucleic acid-binding protein